MGVVFDDFSDTDLIGHSYARDALIDLIQGAGGKSNSSLTLAVYGDWGTGKTTILRQTQSALDASEDFVTVWFNPWQFNNDEEIMSALLFTISGRIAELAKSNTNANHEKNDNLRTLSESVKKAAKAINYHPKIKLNVPMLGDVEFDSARKGNALDDKSATDIAKFFENEISETYFDLVRHLAKACSTTERQIVVFIDDLDRCSQHQTMRLLEGVKTLLDLPKFIFVMGMADRIVQAMINSTITQNSLGSAQSTNAEERSQYLDKIIQFSFHLPRPDVGKVKNNILAPHLDNVSNADELMEIIVDSIGSNPRSLKRFLNTLTFSKLLFARRFENDKIDLDTLVRSALMAHSLPTIYREFQRVPSALIEISNSVANREIGDSLDAIELIQTSNGAVNRLIDNETAVKLSLILYCENQLPVFAKEESVARYVSLALDSVTISTAKPVEEKVHASLIGGDHRSLSKYLSSSMVPIQAGTITFEDDKLPQCVEVSTAFGLLFTSVSQELFQSVMGFNPSKFKAHQRPVESVTWLEAVEFCNLVSEMVGLDQCYSGIETGRSKSIECDFGKNGYRLPSEAEWMLACTYPNEQLTKNLGELAWFIDNSHANSNLLGSLTPTPEGIYDLLGNVWEWTSSSVKYSQDETGAVSHMETDGAQKVAKGGAWTSFASQISPNSRGGHSLLTAENNIGFRIAQSIITEGIG